MKKAWDSPEVRQSFKEKKALFNLHFFPIQPEATWKNQSDSDLIKNHIQSLQPSWRRNNRALSQHRSGAFCASFRFVRPFCILCPVITHEQTWSRTSAMGKNVESLLHCHIRLYSVWLIVIWREPIVLNKARQHQVICCHACLHTSNYLLEHLMPKIKLTISQIYNIIPFFLNLVFMHFSLTCLNLTVEGEVYFFCISVTQFKIFRLHGYIPLLDKIFVCSHLLIFVHVHILSHCLKVVVQLFSEWAQN